MLMHLDRTLTELRLAGDCFIAHDRLQIVVAGGQGNLCLIVVRNIPHADSRISIDIIEGTARFITVTKADRKNTIVLRDRSHGDPDS